MLTRGWSLIQYITFQPTFLQLVLIQPQQKKELRVVDLQLLAERTRFELVVGLLLRQFSKLVVSATHPPLQRWLFADLWCKCREFF